MRQLIYNWQRFWCSRDGGFHIDANGFLLRSEYFKDTVEFESIAEIPCLVLLGEPGIGKSRALDDAVQFVSQSFREDKCFPLDLRSFGSETRLYDALFKSREIEEWLTGTHRLHLFLDSFDECLLRVDTVAALLADELKTGKYPISRLLFRIASRTAEFPRSLENNLREIWGAEEKVKVYELCPLQASDVWEAATTNEINPEDFFREMVAKSAGTLAARPVTLRFLLNLYRKNNRFPDKLTDLYEQGCRVLCDEQNDERRASVILKGTFTADQRLIIAARIAAVMVFCNKIALWKDAETGENDETDVLLRDLSGYSEESGNISFTVTEEAVRETLVQTGLFTARGANRLGWAHQTFAEFLAAWYVARHNLETEQILSLIMHPSDAQQQIAPQLQETVAWLASLRADVFDELLKTNPLLLLRSDVASFSTDIRVKLVDQLLKIFGEEKASDWGSHSNYQRLKHPGLAAQLLTVIKDRDANYLAQRFAIDVAEACELRELQNDLVEVILDENEPDYVRSNAGYALWKVGDAETRRRIKHFALNGSQNDKDERVRGIALLCNWDENMSAEEVFASLVHSPDLHDSYSLFLSSYFTPKLKVEDLPVALRWVKENASQFGGDFSVGRVIDEIMLLAWQNLDAPGILPVFAEVSLIRLRGYQHDMIDLSNIFQGERFVELLADAERRRILLKAIAPLLDEDKHDSFHVSQSQILQPRKEDLFWLFEQLNEATTEEEQKTWLQFLGSFYFPWEVAPEILTILYEVYQHNDAVKKYYSWVFTPVELNSYEAEAQKKGYEQFMAPRKEMEEKLKEGALNPPPRERVLECLDRFERGEVDFWWHLNMQLTLKPYMKVYGDALQFDLRKLPGWEEADAQTRARIIQAAKQYVIEGEPQNNEWVGTNIIFNPAFSGYRALYLLLAESSDFIERLPSDVWRKWAAIIVSYPRSSHSGDEKITHQSLVVRAYTHAPDEVIKTILKKIDAENKKGEIFFFSQSWDVCWDDKFKDALRHKLNDPTLKINTWGRILEELLEHDDAATQKIAQSVLTSFVAGEVEKDRALLAAASLMRHGEGEDWWSFVWKAIEKDDDFGRAVVESICFQTRPAAKLKEDDAAEFYLWLVKVFPPSEDPEIPMGHAYAVSTRMEITSWRNSIPSDLKQRGTPESLVALEKIAAESSELEKQLHWILIEARENVRRHTWQPPTPIALLTLLKQNTPETNLAVTTPSVKAALNDEEIKSLSWNGKTVADIPALFDFLKLYRDRPNDVVFFVGAGLSRPLFPSWEAALDELVTQTSKRLGYTDKEAELRDLLDKGKLLDVANACARDLGENNYRAFIEQQFDKDFTLEDVPQAYAALLNLHPQTILTTNYDRVPEVGGQGRYRIFTNSNIGEAESAIRNNKPTVFNLHGVVTQQNSIVFTRAEYQNTYQNASFRGFIEGLFRFKSVLFLGFGLSDPYFNQVLENIYAGNQRILEGKYALLEGFSQTEIQSKEHGYGLNIIPYRKSDDTHPEVLAFIQLLPKVHCLELPALP
jgi:hypothetical protein